MIGSSLPKRIFDSSYFGIGVRGGMAGVYVAPTRGPLSLFTICCSVPLRSRRSRGLTLFQRLVLIHLYLFRYKFGCIVRDIVRSHIARDYMLGPTVSVKI